MVRRKKQVEPLSTVFANSDPNCSAACAPSVDITDAGVVLVTPEPCGLALLPVAGLLALRRRRTAGRDPKVLP